MKIKKPYLIAEIGINHNGNLNFAKKLIDNAAELRFDSVKFQKRNVNIVYSKEQLDSYRESPWGKTTRQQKQICRSKPRQQKQQTSPLIEGIISQS
jgi:N-acetylneuraminate synthase